MDFGGGGTIYFWIKKQDLLNKDFENFGLVYIGINLKNQMNNRNK